MSRFLWPFSPFLTPDTFISGAERLVSVCFFVLNTQLSRLNGPVVGYNIDNRVLKDRILGVLKVVKPAKMHHSFKK